MRKHKHHLWSRWTPWSRRSKLLVRYCRANGCTAIGRKHLPPVSAAVSRERRRIVREFQKLWDGPGDKDYAFTQDVKRMILGNLLGGR